MSTGRQPISNLVYSGKLEGLYEPKVFDRFATRDIPEIFLRIGAANTERPQCNPEGTVGRQITYHYPSLGVGLTYDKRGKDNCVVVLRAGSSRVVEASALGVILATAEIIKGSGSIKG